VLHYVLETHAHADHLSASQWLKRRFEAKVAIGARITEVQRTFQGVFDLPASFARTGRSSTSCSRTGGGRAGTLRIEVLATPGHTPACLTYKIDDAVFTGDALFIEDYGTGRCDFPAAARTSSTARCTTSSMRCPTRRASSWGTTTSRAAARCASRRPSAPPSDTTSSSAASTSQEEFVTFRKARDATLAAPRLLLPSVQVNIDAGRLPRPHDNGMRYLAIPINLGGRVDEDGSVPPR
jgi:hypothetical protein